MSRLQEEKKKQGRLRGGTLTNFHSPPGPPTYSHLYLSGVAGRVEGTMCRRLMGRAQEIPGCSYPGLLLKADPRNYCIPKLCSPGDHKARITRLCSPAGVTRLGSNSRPQKKASI